MLATLKAAEARRSTIQKRSQHHHNAWRQPTSELTALSQLTLLLVVERWAGPVLLDEMEYSAALHKDQRGAAGQKHADGSSVCTWWNTLRMW